MNEDARPLLDRSLFHSSLRLLRDKLADEIDDRCSYRLRPRYMFVKTDLGRKARWRNLDERSVVVNVNAISARLQFQRGANDTGRNADESLKKE